MDERARVAANLRDMGEPPSSVDYLMRLRFDGEEVTVQRPNWVSQEDEE